MQYRSGSLTTTNTTSLGTGLVSQSALSRKLFHRGSTKPEDAIKELQAESVMQSAVPLHIPPSLSKRSSVVSIVPQPPVPDKISDDYPESNKVREAIKIMFNDKQARREGQLSRKNSATGSPSRTVNDGLVLGTKDS